MRRRWVIAMVVALLASPLAWWSWQREIVPAPQVAPSVAATTATVRPSAMPSTPPASTPSVAAVMPAIASAPVRVAAASAPRDDGRIEVCGHGRVHEHELARLMPEEVRIESLGRIIAALSRGTERERVAGLQLGISLDAEIAQASALRACGENFACIAAMPPRQQAPQHPALDALVQTALGSSDPWTYAAVVSYACRYTTANACAALTPEGWHQRAPDDAAPWLWAGALAAQRKDDVALSAALEMASRKVRLSDPSSAIYGQLLAVPELRAFSPSARIYLLVPAFVDALDLPNQLNVVDTYCSKAQLQAPDRRDRCEALAQLIVKHAPRLMHLRIGQSIGERLGWPRERQDRVEAEMRDLPQLVATSVPPGGFYSCEGIAVIQRLFAEQGALGEVGALRKLRAARAAAASAAPSK